MGKIIVSTVFILLCLNIYTKAQTPKLLNLISNEKDFDGDNAQLFGAQFSYLDDNIISFYRQVDDNRQLWLYNIKTNSLERISTVDLGSNENLIFNTENDNKNSFEYEISWCPVRIKSNQWFVFVSAGGYSNQDLYLAELDEERTFPQYIKLTSDRAVDSDPVWSPDGNRIAFVSNRNKDGGDIFIIDNIKKLINFYYSKRFNKGVEGKLIFDMSPEIEKEIFSNSDEDEIRLIQITDNDNNEMWPNFSPDGQYLAITSRDYDDEKQNYGISIIDLDGYKSPVRFTTSTNDEIKPVWTPDGKYIIYYSSNNYKDNNKSIVASRFVEFGDYAKKMQVVAENIEADEYQKPNVAYKTEDGYSVVYKTYEKSSENFSVWVTPIYNPKKTKLLYEQKGVIENVSTFGNNFVVSRREGDNFFIDLGRSSYLQDYPRRISGLWIGGVSKSSRTLYYYIGGGVAAVGGIIALILNGGDDKVVSPAALTLGTPKNPTK